MTFLTTDQHVFRFSMVKYSLKNNNTGAKPGTDPFLFGILHGYKSNDE